MRKARKRLLAFIMAVTMIVALLPVNMVNAEEHGSETVSEVTTEETVTEQATTETETSTQTTTEEITTEYQEEEKATETTDVTESVLTTEEVAEKTTEEATADDEKEEMVFSKMAAEPKALKSSLSGYEFDTDADKWSGYGKSGWKWYVKSGGSKHYVFCLNEGADMHPGVHDYKKVSGYSGKTSWRFSTALNYFYAINGNSWSGNSQYAAVQTTIWGSSSPALAKYIDHAWELTSENSGRHSGDDSYSSKLTVMRGSQMDTSGHRKSEIAGMEKSKVQTLNKSNLVSGTTYKKTVSLGGKAWKYFSAGGSGTWSDSSAGNRGDVVVYGIYDTNGNKLDGKTASASVASNGDVTVTLDPSSGYGNTKDNPVTVVMRVKMTYTGTSDGITYLKKSGWQSLSYSTASAGSAYFGIQAYAEQGTIANTTVSIEKVDEFENFVPGCTFTLQKDGMFVDRKTINDEIFNYFEIDEEGTYTLQETGAASGTTLNPTVYTFTAEKVTEDGVQKIKINGQTDYKIQCKNNFLPGSVHLTKYADKLVKFENGKFVFQEQAFSGVEFKFYAEQDIYCNGTKIWSAGTEITNGMQWGDSHTVAITGSKTDENGNIKIDNLPAGKYRATEIPPAGYFVPNPNFSFTVTAGEDTPINDGKIVNKIVPCSVQITKVDGDTKKALPGTEITLYAAVTNKNTDGAALVTKEDTVPVVVSRDTETGEEKLVNDKWVPIQTAITDVNGLCSFTELPNGEYLAAETKAVSGYALCEESYTFKHDATAYEEGMHSGITFTHTMEDFKISTLLIIHKTGEVLTKIEDKTSEYGNYKQLVYEQKDLSGITFGVYNQKEELVNTITTNQDGIAKASNLPFGKYKVKEIKTDNEHILDTKEYEVDLTEKPELEIIKAEINVTNAHTKLETSVYKEGEIPEFDDSVTSDEEDIYSYKTAALAGAVFGVYADCDITNYAGEVVVRKNDCLGYCQTDTSGIAAYSGILEAGNYYFKEIKTSDDNYMLCADTVPFTVVWEGKDISQLVNPANPVINEYIKGSIKVIKTDGKEKKYLQGVVFNLMDMKDNLLGEYETDKNGEINIENLPKGIYYLQEKATLKGYKLDDSIREINLTDTNLDQVVKIKNEYNKTSIVARTDTTINGSGSVRTGDHMIWIIFMLMMLSAFLFVYMTGMKRKSAATVVCKKKKQKEFKKFMVFVLIAGMVFSNIPVYAAGNEVPEQPSSEAPGDTGDEDKGEEETLAGTIFTSDGFTYEFDEYYTLTITEIDESVTGKHVVIPDKVEYEGEKYDVRFVDVAALPEDMVSLTIGWNLQEIDTIDADIFSELTNVYVKNMEISIYEKFAENVKITCYKNSAAAKDHIKEWENEPEYFYIHVFYELNGGMDPKNPDIYYLGEELPLSDSKKSGYLFAGWYTDMDFDKESGIDSLDSYIYGSDLTLYAKFVKSEYSITYILNDGTNSPNNTPYYITGKGATLYNPTRSGYRFEGWYTDKDFKNLITDIGMDACEDYTLYAKWSELDQAAASESAENVYTIKYVLNGGTDPGNPAAYKQTSETFTLKNPQRAGYTFGGWYTSTDYKKSIKKVYKGSAGDLTLYAKWNKVSVKKITIKEFRNIRTKKAKVTFKKITGAKGYEIKYSTVKKFAKNKTKTVNTAKLTYTLKKLKKNKTYYVKVRAYKLDSTGSKVYGKYSAVKKVKIRK